MQLLNRFYLIRPRRSTAESECLGSHELTFGLSAAPLGSEPRDCYCIQRSSNIDDQRSPKGNEYLRAYATAMRHGGHSEAEYFERLGLASPVPFDEIAEQPGFGDWTVLVLDILTRHIHFFVNPLPVSIGLSEADLTGLPLV